MSTVTPKSQIGNPKKRLFRLKKDEAIINRLGINNDGVAVIAKRLKNNNTKIIIGGNIGKIALPKKKMQNKTTLKILKNYILT